LAVAEFCYNNTQSEQRRLHRSSPTTDITALHTYLGSQDIEAPEVSEYAEALRRLHEELEQK